MKTDEMTLTLDFDFNMLNRQKKALIERLKGPADSLWGIVHMIDDIQDEAEKQGLWAFPEDVAGNDLGEVRTKKRKTVAKRKER